MGTTEVNEKRQETPFKAKIVWGNVIFFVIFHIAGLYGWWLILTLRLKWQTYLLFWINRIIVTLSTGIGSHRLYAHKAYKAKLPLRILIMLGQTLSGQNSIYTWVRDHRMHHKYSDTNGDPHNSRRGVFFSHMGWLMVKKHPELVTKGKLLDMTDIEKDAVVMFQSKYYYYLYALIGVAYPVFFPLVYGESLRNSFFGLYLGLYLLNLHGIWAVNSIAHVFGNKPYTKDIRSTELMFVSFLTYGEGWHNYHHTFPWDYRAAELGSWFNYSGYVIYLLSKIGWAYDLRYATPEMIAHRVAKNGDGSYPSWGLSWSNTSKHENRKFDVNDTVDRLDLTHVLSKEESKSL